MPDESSAPDEANAEPRKPPKRPPARLRPEALARARGGAREGLDWLGRAPEARASVLYRLLRVVVRFVLWCRLQE